jgi:hypothetical protein
MDNQNTVGAQFKSMKILHAALCLGVIFILIILRLLVKKDSTATVIDNQIFSIVGAVLGFIGVIGSRLLFFIKTRTALSVPALSEKINIYRTALITQMAILEGTSIINAVLYFITKNDLHFFIALGILLFMIFGRPTRMMAGMLLFNNMEDKKQINDDSLVL